MAAGIGFCGVRRAVGLAGSSSPSRPPVQAAASPGDYRDQAESRYRREKDRRDSEAAALSSPAPVDDREVRVLVTGVGNCIMAGDSISSAICFIPNYIAWAKKIRFDNVVSGSVRSDRCIEATYQEIYKDPDSHALLEALSKRLGADFCPVTIGDLCDAEPSGHFEEGRHWASGSSMRSVVLSSGKKRPLVMCKLKTKIPLLWFLAHYWAGREAGKKVRLDFVSHSRRVLKAASDFFRKYHSALPESVTIRFHRYSIKKPDSSKAQSSARNFYSSVFLPLVGSGSVLRREQLASAYHGFMAAFILERTPGSMTIGSLREGYLKVHRVRGVQKVVKQASFPYALVCLSGLLSATATLSGSYATAIGASALFTHVATCSLLWLGSISAITAVTGGVTLAVVGLAVLGYLAYSAYQSCGASRKAAIKNLVGPRSIQADTLKSATVLTGRYGEPALTALQVA